MEELSREEIDGFFSEINVLVCPSRDDPLPTVVTEAMQRGIACIISDQVGQVEYIQNGVNGFIFKSEDIDELTNIMEQLIRNPSSINVIGENSRMIYEEYFSKECMKRKLTQYIDLMLGSETNLK